MAKICPSFSPSLATHDASSLDHVSSEQETFTVWMKSLVLNGNGCTVYDSKGKIVYRVDNYDFKCRGEVYLMDHSGKVLFKILKKRYGVFGRWEGYRYHDLQKQETVPCFKVTKPRRVLKGGRANCEVWSDTGHAICCKMYSLADVLSYKITGISGKLFAEVKGKQTASGVGLGDDVLTLLVEPNIDQSLIMALVVVHGLMNCSL